MVNFCVVASYAMVVTMLKLFVYVEPPLSEATVTTAVCVPVEVVPLVKEAVNGTRTRAFEDEIAGVSIVLSAVMPVIFLEPFFSMSKS